jgi:flavin reductase (DIM6/NTAB) family NADH-FMN oxidoreductase RutF
MDEDAKKTALRMIPYGMFILTAKAKEGQDISAATVNWITQASFAPPLIAVGVKADSGAHQHIKDTSQFAINVIGKDQINTIGGENFEDGPETGCPLFINSPAWWECKVVGEVAQGDHTLFVGEVLEAGVRTEDQTILMRDHNLNYGG